MTTSHRARFDDGPGFNHEAADLAYDAIAKCATDEEASVVASMFLGEMLSHDLIVHRAEIGKALRAQAQARTVEIGKALIQRAAEMEREGQDSTEVLRGLDLLEEISKAGFTSDERAQSARKQKRDLLSGRFVQEHKDVLHLPSEKPLHSRDAAILGIPSPLGSLNGRQMAMYQRGYREVQDLLDRYDGLKPTDGALHLNYSSGPSDVIAIPSEGRLRIKQTDKTTGEVTSPGIDPKRKLTSVQLSVLPSTDLDGPGAQARFGDALGDGGLLNDDTWNPSKQGSLADELTRSTDNEQFTPGARAVRRVGALSEALDNSLGDRAPARVKLALKVGQKAGELGPEAQKVIGPAADRAAYRYRGTERTTPDSRLMNAVNSIWRSPELRGGEKREFMVHGRDDDQGNWHPSGVLAYMRSRLPRADLNTLQRKSGTIPPSEGVIIDRKGKVASQAVGYADDHYLPFNLRKLAKLKGGEYLRTRTFGGPTTEDIYTGLIGSARSLTVVSHNGVYTMEFDDDLKGGRRFNDKAARMVTRYGQLLDAVKSQQVTTGGIHPSRLAELESAAGRIYDQDRDPEQYSRELDRLKTAEKRRPVLSARQKQEATAEFFENMAADRRTPDGHVMSAQEMSADFITQRAQQTLANSGLSRDQITPGAVRDTVGRVRAQLESDDPAVAGRNLADAMGVRRGLDAHLERAQSDYAKSLTPLQLNSQGYQLALTALQEQFPYYIKRVDFHPWEGGGDSFDTGYVAPKHNRPAAALAGYFDRNVTGQGKVRADSTRFQNFGVRQGKLVPVEDKAKAEEGRRAGAAGGGPHSGTVTSGEPDPETKAELKRDSMMAMVNEIRRHPAFSPRATSAIANQPVENHLAAMTAPESEAGAKMMAYLRTTDLGTLEQRARDEPAKLAADINSALRANETANFFDIDPSVRRGFANEGRYERPKELVTTEAAKHLDDPAGTEYSIPGSVFDQDSQHDPGQIESAYAADGRIDAVRKAGLITASLADGAEFDKQAAAAKRSLIDQRRLLTGWKARRAGGGYAGAAPVEEHTLNMQAEGVLRALQLRRRFMAAQQRATIAMAGRVKEHEDSVIGGMEVHFHGADDDQIKRIMGS